MSRKSWCIVFATGFTVILVGLISLTGLYIAFSALDGTLNSKWYPWKVNESKRTGNELVQAIDRYKQKEGHYPAALDDLVPHYLPRIRPPTAGGQQWTYGAEQDGSGFNLAFEDVSASVPRWYYTSYGRRWYFKSF